MATLQALVVIVIALLFDKITAAGEQLYLRDNIKLQMSIAKENLRFNIISPKDQWVGFGYGNSMTTTEMFSVETIDGNTKVTDLWSERQKRPQPKDENNYVLVEYSFANGFYNYTVERPLKVPASEHNFIIPKKGEFSMTYTWGSTQDMHYHGPARYGGIRVKINQATKFLQISHGEVDAEAMTFFKYHGTIMFIIWAILPVVVIFTGQYQMVSYKLRIYTHMGLGMLMTFVTAGFTLYIWNRYHTKPYDGSFGSFHNLIGKAIFGWVTAHFALGVIVRIVLSSLKWHTHVIYILRDIHQYSGYTLVIVSNIQLYSGLASYGYNDLTALLGYHITVPVLYFTWYKYNADRQIIRKNIKERLDGKNLPAMSLEEFEISTKRGNKYVLFDNYIIDVSEFASEHPGSAFALLQNIGKDIGKFYCGANHLEADIKPHTHSAIADRILYNLAIAKVPTSRFKLFILNDNDYYSLLDSNYVFRVCSVEDFGDEIKRVTFKGEGLKIQHFYSGMSLFGKSISITSPKTNITRYYSLCQCMWTGIYPTYLRALKAASRDLPFFREYETIADFQSKTDSFLEIIMKVYSESENGISSSIANSNYNEKYYISGPFGIGLDVTKGDNLFIVAGTGILPFMDLFAYLARQILKNYNSKYAIFKDEVLKGLEDDTRFYVYAYFKSKEDAPGLELCEKLASLCKKLNLQEKFVFKPKFSSPQSRKMNLDTIVRNAQFSNVNWYNKMYVCGTPSFNQFFEQNAAQISDNININIEDIVIL